MRCAIDAYRFDRLAKSLSFVAARRRVLQLVATLPIAGGLATFLDEDEADAGGRRKRRKKAHKHGKGRRKRKPPCNAHSRDRTCAGKCGRVKNNCRKTVDCGPCDCDPACGTCFTCQGAGGQPGTCVPADSGTPCGSGNLCCAGSCETGVCCANADCTSEEAPDCVDHDCVCVANSDAPCSDGQTCCSAGCANLPTDPQNCGACGEACSSGQTCQDGACGEVCGSDFCPAPDEACCANACVDLQTDAQNCGACGESCGTGQVCQGGVCGEVCGSDFCPSPGEVCCNGSCCDGCCGADGSCGACLVFVSSSLYVGDLSGLEGADQSCQSLANNVTPAPLPGVYKAWLSDRSTNQSPAGGRFRRSGQPYQLVNGTQIAANWADLTDGSLASPISVTESGYEVGSWNVWTGTYPDGTRGDSNCYDWIVNYSDVSGTVGFSDRTQGDWSHATDLTCELQNPRLYCFQQR